MIDAYSLSLNSSVVDLSSKTSETTPILELTEVPGVSTSWRRNITWYGGADLGEFTVYGSRAELNEIFGTWLGLDVLEGDMGIDTWNGQIIEMYYNTTMPRRVSLARMHNRVKCLYNDGEEDAATTWADHDESQARYGVREYIFSPQVYNKVQALLERTYHLRRYGWPPIETFQSNRKPGDREFIKCVVAGYKWSMNNYYCERTNLGFLNPTRSSALEDFIDDSQYVNVRNIETNSQQINSDIGDERAWDYCLNLLQLSDDTYNLWRGWITPKRDFYYEAVDIDVPDYYIVNGEIRSESSPSAQIIKPRHVRPGIFRDMDWPQWGAARNHYLADRADILVQNVTVDQNGMLQYHPADSSVGEFLARYRSNENAYEYDPENPLWGWPGQQAKWEEYPEIYEQHD